jgi:cobalamin biosynthesis Mg chelatase CobN
VKVPRTAILVGVLLAATPAVASAQGAGPPGNSAVDQYRESAPPASSGSKKLSRAQREALSDRGDDGAALASALDRSGGVPTAAGSASDGAAPDALGAATGSGAKGGSGAGGTDAEDANSSRSDAGPRSPDDAGSEAGSATTAAPPSDPGATPSRSATEAAASTTVGPFPVWVMVLAALVVVAVGLAVRRRPSA